MLYFKKKINISFSLTVSLMNMFTLIFSTYDIPWRRLSLNVAELSLVRQLQSRLQSDRETQGQLPSQDPQGRHRRRDDRSGVMKKRWVIFTRRSRKSGKRRSIWRLITEKASSSQCMQTLHGIRLVTGIYNLDI